MPGLSLSELFTWRSRSDDDDVIIENKGWILRAENFERGEYSMPNSDLNIVNAQLDRIEELGPQWDLRCFYQRDPILASVTGFSTFFAMFLSRQFFQFGPWQYLMCAPPVFIMPYLFTRLDQTSYVTNKVLLGDGLRCPLCVMTRAGLGFSVTSALTCISLSSVMSYGVTYLFGNVRKLPPPSNLNGLIRLGWKFFRTNRVSLYTIVASNFTFGFWFAYLQVCGFHALHKADVRNAQRLEFERQRKLE